MPAWWHFFSRSSSGDHNRQQWKRKRKKKLRISPPIHLLLQQPSDECHSFRAKLFRRSRPCHLCHQPIVSHGSCCRVCKYICHKACEPKHHQSGQQPAANRHCNNNNLSAESNAQKTATMNSHRTPLQQHLLHTPQFPTENSSSPLPASSPSSVSPSSPVSSTTSSNSHQCAMDLSYASERIIALVFPDSISAEEHGRKLGEAVIMLEEKHRNNYKVFNVSRDRLLMTCVVELGWPDRSAPSLETLLAFCTGVDEWLRPPDGTANNKRVAVVHSRSNGERVSLVLSAYLSYLTALPSRTLSTDDGRTKTDENASAKLDRFALQRYLQERSALTNHTPSEIRYLTYFNSYLMGTLPTPTTTRPHTPLQLSHVRIHGAPAFEIAGGCCAFLKILQDARIPLYLTPLYEIGPTKRGFTIRMPQPVSLRGNITIIGYHLVMPAPSYGKQNGSKSSVPSREVMFRAQFLTSAIDGSANILFRRDDLDVACNDLRFPLDGTVELNFVSNDGSPAKVRDDPEPLVPDQQTEAFMRSESVEEMREMTVDTSKATTPVRHTAGPVDGALYATVDKRLVTQDTGSSQPSDEPPRTLSMDSGISSSTGVVNNNNNNNGISATVVSNNNKSAAAASGGIRKSDISAAHAELDALLRDMMLDIQNIPDLPPASSTGPVRSVSFANGYVSNHGDSIPYHARPDSRPFTYGGMIDQTDSGPTRKTTNRGLSSPTLVRKAMGTSSLPSSPSLSPSSAATPLRQTYNSNYNTSVAPSWSADEGFTSLDESRHSYYSAPASHSSEASSSSSSWLQRQQFKLRQRREMQLRSERLPQEARLLTELRAAQRQNAERGVQSDGYQSDVTREGSPSKFIVPTDAMQPLHVGVNDKGSVGGGRSSAPVSPLLSSGRNDREQRTEFYQQTMPVHPLTRQQSDSSFDRERPFVAVRRAHEENMRNYYGGGGRNDQTLLATSSPVGYSQVPYYYNNHTRTIGRDGLLTTMDDGPRRHYRSTSYSSGNSQQASPRAPPTPSFPVAPQTPYFNNSAGVEVGPTGLPPRSPTTHRKDRSPSPSALHHYQQPLVRSPSSASHYNTYTGEQLYYSPSTVSTLRRSASNASAAAEMAEVSPADVKFARDVSRFWYKPNISREEAIAVLRTRQPGSFIVRDSNSFAGAFGLALKVASPPPNVGYRQGQQTDPGDELVRHFLIEPTKGGVRLKGCPNEPVFSSLSALVYQHSVTPLAFPCRLVLPTEDLLGSVSSVDTVDGRRASATQQLLAQGAACNVLYLFTMDTESLTGPQAVRKATTQLFLVRPTPRVVAVHFKVSAQGITLTDNQRSLFFRRHYPISAISFCGLDEDGRNWTQRSEETGMPVSCNRVFGFVARKPASVTDNQCHLFAELEPGQPAAAIVNFVAKVMMSAAANLQRGTSVV